MNLPQPISPRRRLQELLAIPDSQRSDAEWDELNELEISLAPGNRAGGPDPSTSGRNSSPRRDQQQGRQNGPGGRRDQPSGRKGNNPGRRDGSGHPQQRRDTAPPSAPPQAQMQDVPPSDAPSADAAPNPDGTPAAPKKPFRKFRKRTPKDKAPESAS